MRRTAIGFDSQKHLLTFYIHRRCTARDLKHKLGVICKTRIVLHIQKFTSMKVNFDNNSTTLVIKELKLAGLLSDSLRFRRMRLSLRPRWNNFEFSHEKNTLNRRQVKIIFH